MQTAINTAWLIDRGSKVVLLGVGELQSEMIQCVITSNAGIIIV